MNRIDQTLKQLQNSGKKILSPYITAGDPDPGMTVELMHTLVKAGADMIELGIPFSDPMAEGPVIQAAMERALKFDVDCTSVLNMVREFRKKDDQTPIILMGYLNPIEQYGYEAFAQDAHQAGVDGTIIVDLPPEESHDVAPIWKSAGLHSIYLCSPTTRDERMKHIQKYAGGYLYFVSLKGVTGANTFDLQSVIEQYKHYKEQTHLPVLVGFGIKTPERAAQVAEFSNGVIVGAALISQICEANTKKQNPLKAAAAFISDMRDAIDSGNKS